MDPQLREYAPYWLVGYYYLERRCNSSDEINYNYRTTVIGIEQFLGGLQKILENFHGKQVVIIFVHPIAGFKQDVSNFSNVYVDFKSLAGKLVRNELTERCAELNRDFYTQSECIIDLSGLKTDILNAAEKTVEKMIKTEADKVAAELERKLKLFWEEVVLRDILD